MTKLQSKALQHISLLIKQAQDISTHVYDWQCDKEKEPYDFAAQNVRVQQKDYKLREAQEWISVIEQ